MVRIGAQERIVHALIEKPSLLPGGFGRKRCGYLPAFPVHGLAEISHKGRIAFPILWKDILKIHIHAGITLFSYRFQQISNQYLLHFQILRDRFYQLVIKIPLFRKRG